MKFNIIASLLLGATLLSCAGDDSVTPPQEGPGDVPEQTVTLTLADGQATPETRALYSNLWAIREKGFMFGHHDDLWYGRYWYGDEGGSDTKAVCGDYPAVFSCDFAEVMDDRYLSSSDANALRLRSILEARRRGEVITACMHLNNPLTGGDAWDNSDSHVAKEILTEGSATNVKFCKWLDRLVDFTHQLVDDNGQPIPVIFRPFHEHTQNWSWWGSYCTTQAQFIQLWKFTVDYLRAAGVHQFVYAISPQMDSQKKEDDFLYRWPGDDYVDFIGMDCYHGINNAVFSANLKTISALSDRLLKPCGVTETGVEGFTAKKYWTDNILTPATGRKISLVVTWRNKYVGSNETDRHFYSVYPGHASEDNFRTFYDSPLTFFSKDLPNMYKMAKNVSVK